MAKTDYETQLAELDEEKETALREVDESYSDQIEQNDAFYDSQIKAVQGYKDTQTEIQQAQTDFTIGQIQQQKDQAQKNYTKEQSAAYVDFKKQSDPHGANAERIAAGGMWGSGYSESAQTAMYNEYQRRVATAKASFDQAVANYNNAMTQAQLQNSSVLAEIAFNALTQEIELTMKSFISRNALLEEQASARAQVESNYLSAVGQLQENQYDVKPSTSDPFTKWVTYLRNEYPNGYISDAALWKELVDTYGETALKQAGLTNTAPTVGVTVEGNNVQPAGTNIEQQLIKLGMAGISPQELLRRVQSGEIIMTQLPDGSYILERGKRKTGPGSNAGASLGMDGIDMDGANSDGEPTSYTGEDVYEALRPKPGFRW